MITGGRCISFPHYAVIPEGYKVKQNIGEICLGQKKTAALISVLYENLGDEVFTKMIRNGKRKT